MAANMGAMAESFGLRAGIKYRSPVKKALETVLMIDRGFQQGSADRALGRWYLKVPRLFGGSKDKSVEHLQAVTHLRSRRAPRRTTSSPRPISRWTARDEARQEAQKVLDCPSTRTGRPKIASSSRKPKTLLERLQVAV